MARDAIAVWEGTEYSFEERSTDWYWALGVVAAAATIASILFGNVLLALVIVAGATTVALQAAKHQRVHRFALYDEGVAIDNDLYLFEDMRDFSVLEYLDESLPPALSIKTNHLLAPHLLIPINDVDPYEVYEFISERLPEGMHEDTVLDRLAAYLKF